MPRKPSKLVKGLLSRAGEPRGFSVTYYSRRDAEMPYGLLEAFGVRPEQLSNAAKTALDAIEECSGDSEHWLKFRWRLSAFVGLQDVFDISMPLLGRHFRPENIADIFQVYYFYHESRLILLESFLAGLNGLYVASSSLLRIFLEFSIFQNYYYRLGKNTGSYRELASALREGRYPAWMTALKGSLPKAKFCHPIHTRIEKHRQALSQSSQHVYGPTSSSRSHRSEDTGHSLEGLYFWFKTDLILSAVLWVYCVNFPCLFFPVDVVRKFGFNGPVGLFADLQAGIDIRKSLGDNDWEKFRAFAASESAFEDALAWCQGRPDLSDEEIWKTWDDESNGPKPDSLEVAQCLSRTKMRALGIAMAYGKGQEKEGDKDSPPDEWLERIDTLELWRRIGKG